MWAKIIYNTDSKRFQSPSDIEQKQPDYFTNQIAEGLFNDFVHLNKVIKLSDSFPGDFNMMRDPERSFWLDYALNIPEKFSKLNLFIRPFENQFRTCIITDRDIELLVRMDLERYCIGSSSAVRKADNMRSLKGAQPPLNYRWQKRIKNRNRFFLELNYLIPAQIKKCGYEVIRTEEATEIDIPLAGKLARAIHSKYLNEMRRQGYHDENNQYSQFLHDPGDSSNRNITSFDELPEEIKYSNIDNAIHIPTKLLSIGYKIRQVKKGYKPLTLHLDDDEIETMARVEHIRWSWEKRLAGWIYDSIKDESKKTHPSLVPYEALSESEKQKDRELVKLIPALLKDIDYEACPISPNRIKKLSYAIKPHSIIQKILDETMKLNDQLRNLVIHSPALEDMVLMRNRKIEEAIREVVGSYNYAQHIQETFLPDDLYVRECFPDSFVLFKPKDIVSGDFYFFSKRDQLTIFAAADCTGHGIPGALLSTIGYGILGQAVNEIKLTDPSGILLHIYSRIHRFLHNDSAGSGLSDDMDIILCILDTRTNILTYAGVKNPLFLIKNGELAEYHAKNNAGECDSGGDCIFSSETIQLTTGDTIYLFSDGYTDQFGGSNHKKFQSVRLKKLLKDIYRYSMPEQSDMLYEEIEQWREEDHEDQTDDILAIGIRI